MRGDLVLNVNYAGNILDQEEIYPLSWLCWKEKMCKWQAYCWLVWLFFFAVVKCSVCAFLAVISIVVTANYAIICCGVFCESGFIHTYICDLLIQTSDLKCSLMAEKQVFLFFWRPYTSMERLRSETSSGGHQVAVVTKGKMLSAAFMSYMEFTFNF